MSADYRRRRATVMGLGNFGGGLAAARWLARQGAVVTVTDLADQSALADSLRLLDGVPIAALHLGGHCEDDFRNADLVVVNPAVRPDSPWLHFARKSAGRVAPEIELFLENCPARTIGVTGSNGKSTTAAMIASILAAAGRQTFLGGNIGRSLLDDLPAMRPDDWVVLEISSFQLWHLSPDAPMPHIAVVTGCTPNHLDWHPTFADYASAKQRILKRQQSGDAAVLNPFDPEVASWSPMTQREIFSIPSDLPLLKVLGRHNQINAACAAAAATAAGCDCDAIRRGLEQFRGLPQRMEHVATLEGRRFYNDSAATTPESTIAALHSLDSPIWLLAGGKNKGFDFAPLASEIAARARGAAFFGAAAQQLQRQTEAAAVGFDSIAVETLEEALDWCWNLSRPGEAILLSPGCASTDQFRNFQHRGERFVELVANLSKTLVPY